MSSVGNNKEYWCSSGMTQLPVNSLLIDTKKPVPTGIATAGNVIGRGLDVVVPMYLFSISKETTIADTKVGTSIVKSIVVEPIDPNTTSEKINQLIKEKRIIQLWGKLGDVGLIHKDMFEQLKQLKLFNDLNVANQDPKFKVFSIKNNENNLTIPFNINHLVCVDVEDYNKISKLAQSSVSDRMPKGEGEKKQNSDPSLKSIDKSCTIS